MQMENQVDYIKHNFKSFDYLAFFTIFCSAKNSSESIEFFKTTIETIKNEAIHNGENCSSDLLIWCEHVEENNCAVLQTDALKSLWNLKDTASTVKNFNESYQLGILKEIDKSINSSNDKSKRKLTPILPMAIPRVERDPVLFGSISVSTILKKDAINNFLQFIKLSAIEQYRISLGLNSTINLTNVECQQILFTSEEWSKIKAAYAFRLRDRSKLPGEFKSKLKKIKRDIDVHSLDAAYDQIRTLELTSKNEPTKRFYAIYAHVIRVYKERAYILRTIRVSSEADSLIKLWGEVFELLFGGNQEIYLRWGETTSGITTQKKKLNRSDDKNVVGMKVDCRAVAFFERENLDVDLMNMEAAKVYKDDKIFQDRAKLVAEAKCSLDYFLDSPALTAEKKANICIPVVQIAGAKCELCSYRLVADGLYALDSVGSLTVSPICTEFSENALSWFKLLTRLKTMVLNLHDTSSIIQQKNESDFNSVYINASPSTSTRGTFFPPTEASPVPILPSNLYGSSCPPLDDDNTIESSSNKKLKNA